MRQLDRLDPSILIALSLAVGPNAIQSHRSRAAVGLETEVAILVVVDLQANGVRTVQSLVYFVDQVEYLSVGCWEQFHRLLSIQDGLPLMVILLSQLVHHMPGLGHCMLIFVSLSITMDFTTSHLRRSPYNRPLYGLVVDSGYLLRVASHVPEPGLDLRYLVFYGVV